MLSFSYKSDDFVTVQNKFGTIGWLDVTPQATHNLFVLQSPVVVNFNVDFNVPFMELNK